MNWPTIKTKRKVFVAKKEFIYMDGHAYKVWVKGTPKAYKKFRRNLQKKTFIQVSSVGKNKQLETF